MIEYQLIRNLLKMHFNVEHGIPLGSMVDAYVQNVQVSGRLEEVGNQLRMMLSDERVNWVEVFSNKEYEVRVFESEADARKFAEDVLLAPIVRSLD